MIQNHRRRCHGTYHIPTIILLLTLAITTTSVKSQEDECFDDYADCSTRDEIFDISTNLDDYYSSATTFTGGMRKGADLKAKLNSIIQGHKRYNYKCVWTALADIDADPNNPDNVLAIYTQSSISRLNRASCRLQSGGNNGDQDAWNREHLWPKSHGFPSKGQHAYTDLHHLVPADLSVNSDRSNNDFKDGGTSKVCKEGNLCCADCKEDSANKTWEPTPAVKGQIARMMFYMDVRYEGNDQGTTRTPDLKLVDEGTENRSPELGYLSDLLKWHCMYPVTAAEKRRNDSVQSWQGNRNPFIDRPEFVKAIWNGPEFDAIWKNCESTSAGTGNNEDDGANTDEVEAEVEAEENECFDDYADCSTRDEIFDISTNLDDYYSSTSTFIGRMRKGADLKAKLNSIIQGHKRYNYKCVWTALADIDADPNNPDNVLAIYTQSSISRLNRASCRLQSGGNNGDQDAWNREHLWPKSHGFPSKGQHAYTDLHHLVPADLSVNSDRSNNDFKDGGTSKVCKEGNLCCADCKEDSANKTWEPTPAVKGQIARMMFYMDVRYEGNDQGTTRTPDLKLVDEGTENRSPELGYLSDLLKWHCMYPVTAAEKKRNDSVQSWQGNRNPFIDRPEFVKAIWNGPEFDAIWENCDSIIASTEEL